ncbi:MAG: hypothetical protein ACOCYN_01760 [Planctomycetota bacterium]
MRSIPILLVTLLCCAPGAHAAEPADPADEQPSPRAVEQESLQLLEAQLDRRLTALRERAHAQPAVAEAHRELEAAIAAYFATVDAMPELQKLEDEREHIERTQRKTRSQRGRRFGFEKMLDLAERWEAAITASPDLQAADTRRQEAHAAYLSAVEQALADDPDHAALQQQRELVERNHELLRQQRRLRQLRAFAKHRNAQRPPASGDDADQEPTEAEPDNHDF